VAACATVVSRRSGGQSAMPGSMKRNSLYVSQPAIFEGTFEHGAVPVRVDLLQRRRDGRWRLIEVESGCEVGAPWL
jgi:hypothetical protein